MTQFEVGDFRLEAIRERRADLPNGMKGESFDMKVFWQGQPLDLYPNHPTEHPHPNRPNVLAMRWIAPAVQPVTEPFNRRTNERLSSERYREIVASDVEEELELIEWRAADSKPGSDFRRSWFASVIRRATKAVVASRNGLSIKGLSNEVYAGETQDIRDLLAGRFSPPSDLLGQTVDDAVRTLTGIAPREGPLIGGTVTNILTTYDGEIEPDGTDDETGGSLLINQDTRAGYAKFDLSSISATDTVNDVSLRWEIAFARAGALLSVGPYGTDGSDDPDADSGTTKYSRAVDPTQYLTGLTDGQATGVYTNDLGATADSHLEAQLGSIYSVGFQREDAGNSIDIHSIEDATTDTELRIEIDHTGAGGGASPSRRLLLGVG